MGEIKSVKVDNWGVFFLQKLQNFFNKTDYCDLTLQFNDNSQLKVHRLVLSACTDYFNVLEQTCEFADDVLIMPPLLQADVIVPIVNFMYTGTLEFEIDMYARLLKTARDMNMTVLLKLLEAHKRTVDNSRTQQLKRLPKTFPNRRVIQPGAGRGGATYGQQTILSSDQRRTVPVSSHQLKTLQIKTALPSTSYYAPAAIVSEPATLVAKYPHSKTTMKGPSRFECNDETTLPPDSFEQFDSISYESKPLITANQASREDIEDYDALIPAHDTSSTFEQLRKGYTGNKRPPSSVSSFESPPEKKPNIEDVKEYAEQQRMRKQITAEYDDDNEYDEVLDDEFHNDDDDEDYVPPAHIQKAVKKQTSPVVKHDKEQKPTIVVKDTVGSNVNHAKIISEVLKKYPHLVKNNKNIKLKIMAKSSTSPNQQQNIIIKQEPGAEQSTSAQTQTASHRPVGFNNSKVLNVQNLPPKPPAQVQKPAQVVPATNQRQQQGTQSVSKPKIITQKIPVATNPAPRRIDSKTMHSLIAQGAENTSGPWLCLRCGVNGRPISIPSYRGFRRHLVNIHKEKIDARLCEYCGWRSGNDNELYHHMKVQHDVNPPVGYNFPQCGYCPSILLNKAGFDQHMKDEHPNKIEYNQQCMYCEEEFRDEDELFNHMQTQHKSQAQKDGLIDYSDEEDMAYYGESSEQSSDNKIKILSSITISPQSGIKSSAGKIGTETLSSVATGIAASLGLIDSSDSQEIQYLEEGEFINTASTSHEPKFVNADGQVMELTQEQRDEIISQLENQPEGGVVMVLNQDSFAAGTVDAEAGKLDAVDENLLAEYNGNEKSETDKKKEPTRGDEQMDWQSDSQSSVDQAAAKTKEAETIETKDEELKNETDTNTQNESMGEEEEEIDQSANTNETVETKVEGETEKLEKAKEKLKLLAGDWSDDEEDANEESAENSKTDSTIKSPAKEAEAHEKTNDDEKEILFETTTDVGPDKNIDEQNSETQEGVKEEKENVEETEENNKSSEDVEKVKEEEQQVKTECKEEDEEKEKPKSTTKPPKKTKTESDNKQKETKDKSESKTDGVETEDKDTKEQAKDKTDDEIKKEGDGDHIRSLISEWGDDEDL